MYPMTTVSGVQQIGCAVNRKMACSPNPTLEIEKVIGFNGSVVNGLKVHPDGEYLIYPLGYSVMIENIQTKKCTALSGHTNTVTCVAVSQNYIASGQLTHMGFTADVIIWDFKKREKYATLSLHKVKVQDLAFSPNEKYLLTLGGQDDGSVVIWNVKTKQAICGSPAQVKSAGVTYCVAYSQVSDKEFVTGGNGTLRVWTLDVEGRKITANNVNMGQLQREVRCIQMADKMDHFFYCGTTSGDIIAINMKSNIFQFLGPQKDKFKKGVVSLELVKDDGKEKKILVGSGDGEVAMVKFQKNESKDAKGKKDVMSLKKIVSWKDKNSNKSITSIALRGIGQQFYVATEHSQVYRFGFATFANPDDTADPAELIKTCQWSKVCDVIFAKAADNLIVTAQKEEIRIWDLKSGKEKVRETVPNMTCNAIDISPDGSVLLTAWDDGRIRVYRFGKGCLLLALTIEAAHSKGVTAVAYACKSEGERIVSGGGEGTVCVWSMTSFDNGLCTSSKVATMKEHKGLITDIKIEQQNQNRCVSASTDGTCIIWNLARNCRDQTVFSNTLFQAVCFGATGNCQIITGGSDRKIAFWEVADGGKIRDLDASKSGSINTIDICPESKYFVSGGDDRILKLWNYEEGTEVTSSLGHSAKIIKVKISPNRQNIVSVSEDGAIIVWKFPNLN